MPFFSLCMIVKDEENSIRQCLESVQGLADEIIIVDTGSTDRTKDIASEFTDLIFDYSWTNDFSAARNHALEKATGAWILILDADEYVVPEKHSMLLNILKLSDPSSPSGFIVPILNLTGSGSPNENLIESFAVRIFANHSSISFHNPIHEQVRSSEGELPLTRIDYKIYHTGYTSDIVKSKNKRARNLSIFQEMAMHKKFDEYDYFTLGNEYDSLGDKKKALYYYKRADTRRSQDKSFIIHCKYKMVTLLAQSGKMGEALSIIEECIYRWPNYVDFLFLKASYYHYLGYDQPATLLFNQCISTAEALSAKNQNFWIISPNSSTMSYLGLKEIYLRKQDHSNAVVTLTKLIELRNNELIHIQELVNILLQTDDVLTISTFLNKLYKDEPLEKAALRLFQASLLVGNPQLSIFYYQECKRLDIRIPSNYQMHYATITNNEKLFKEALRSGDELIADPSYFNRLIGLAYYMWEDRSLLLHLIKTENNQRSIETLNFLPSITEATTMEYFDSDLIVQILLDLFKSGQYDHYDKLINTFPSQFKVLANTLGNYFFHCHQIELAFDYYSVLLKKNALESIGHLNIGYYYLSAGNIKEAIEFFKNALELDPKIRELYPLLFSILDNQKEKEKYLSLYNRYFPEYANLKLNG